MKNLFFFLSLSLLLLIACNSVKEKNCTMEYRMLTISVRDSLSRPILLSQYHVKKVNTGEIIDFKQEDPYSDSISRLNGVYILLADSKIGMTSQNGTEFEFYGLTSDSVVVSEKYIVGNDGCHVETRSGKTEIMISSR
jgi:hypothetical protein